MTPKWITNLIDSIRSFTALSPCFIDGALYTTVALFVSLQTSYGTDEAAKYLAPNTLFHMRTWFAAIASSLIALKMFRSNSYADHVSKKKESDETTMRIKAQVEGK